MFPRQINFLPFEIVIFKEKDMVSVYIQLLDELPVTATKNEGLWLLYNLHCLCLEERYTSLL